MLMLPASAPGAPFGTAKLAEDGCALMLSVLAPQLLLRRQEGVAAAGIDHVTRVNTVAPAVIGVHIQVRVARSALLDLDHFLAFARVRAALARVIVEHLVEVLPPHLERVRRTRADGARKGVSVVAALVVRLEVRTGLEDAESAHLVEHAEPFEDRQIHRQQRLADVEARVARLLQRNHAVAAAREQCGGRAAARAAADHCYVTLIDCHATRVISGRRRS
jgi:hypothetical protein